DGASWSTVVEEGEPVEMQWVLEQLLLQLEQ
ncbi:hypothetical protein Tco_0589611, partial [Tanacetum coccineum]